MAGRFYSRNLLHLYAGPILDSRGQPVDVATLAQFDQVSASCNNGNQNPIVFDADGSLTTALGMGKGVVGFASPCKLDSTGGYIVSALAVLNGKWQDGVSSNGELSAADFNAAIVHELGHFSGVGHSQINVQVLSTSCNDDLSAGLPLMFPIVKCPRPVDASGFPVLATDDLAAISRLYPNAQTAASYGTISGTVFFSDGLSHAQGVNVIARRLDDASTGQDESLRIAVSAVSGERFTSNPGQDVTGDNSGGDPSGSRNPQFIGKYEIPVPPGTYTIEVESVNPGFVAGSSLTPLDPPVPLSGPPEFWNQNESAFDVPQQLDTITVHAGETIQNVNIIQNGTPPRFDQFEDGAKLNNPLQLLFAAFAEVRS